MFLNSVPRSIVFKMEKYTQEVREAQEEGEVIFSQNCADTEPRTDLGNQDDSDLPSWASRHSHTGSQDLENPLAECQVNTEKKNVYAYIFFLHTLIAKVHFTCKLNYKIKSNNSCLSTSSTMGMSL